MDENHAITISKEHCQARTLGGLNSQPLGKFPCIVIKETGVKYTGKPIKASRAPVCEDTLVKKKKKIKKRKSQKKKRKKKRCTSFTTLQLVPPKGAAVGISS